MDIKGTLGPYKLLKTDDGTNTIYSSYFDENCHSTAGALEETIYNYIEGCELESKLLTNDQITIFEVGFGAGLGPMAVFGLLKKYPNKKVTMYSTELDESFCHWVVNSDDFLKVFNHASIEENLQNQQPTININIDNFKLIILIGDARETINHLKKNQAKVDCIFQDPFSPKKNPRLWTHEWFRDLYSISKETVLLSTYSASTSIRKAMIAAGFYIEKRKGFKFKRSSTRAARSAFNNQEHIYDELQRSPTPALKDDNIREVLDS